MITRIRRLGVTYMLLGLLCSCASPSNAGPSRGTSSRAPQSQLVHPGPDGKLVYTADENGNTIPDFSNCGYHGGGVRIPDVAVKATVAPESDAKDDTARIQQAINEVAKMPRDHNG